ncbi:MAG: hypothetical protein H7318_05440 [Oligoflexus sp.]|nr:hypothetical protein [Oligoflexus sp.]
MKSLSLISLSLLTTIACSRVAHENSHNKEQIDAANNLITQYGLSEMPTYDELVKYPVVETKDAAGQPKLPWTDTYWATSNKNLAARWGFINNADEANQDRYSDFKIGAFFQTQVDAIAANSDLPLNFSPAEKFDIAYRSLNNLVLKKDNASLTKLIALDPRHEEFGKENVTQEGRLVSKRKLAQEYLFEMSSKSQKETSISLLSPLAAEGYTNWINSSLRESNLFPGESGEGMDWSWEGICHGWAPAAVMSLEPKHAVQVSLPDPETKAIKNLIFSEGDIRALLDKSWAQARNPEQFFIGRRCEKNLAKPSLGVPSNAEGRGVTGTMTYIDDKGATIEGQFTVVQDYPRKGGNQGLYRVILENEWKGGLPRYAYLLETSGRTSKTYKLTYNEADAFKQLERASNNNTKSFTVANSVEFLGCWDVNPASFHSVLVENIGKKNIGFVMDRTQSAQVWNQPIGKAEFTIGELKAVKDLGDTDKARFYRAPGTAFVAEVVAVVTWAAEPGSPRFSYTRDGQDFDAEQQASSTYDYTLEFDAKKKLIGGEWGSLGTFKTTENPDFLFGYSKIVEPNLDNAAPFLKSGYKSIIKKIHDCSLSDKTDGEVATAQMVDGKALTLPYSKCAL